MKYILALDGGGIRGVITAVVLREIEQQTGKRIGEMFDLIAGTSTGGILALGLALQGEDGRHRYSADELLNLYAKRGKDIFSANTWEKIRGVFQGPTYSARPIEGVLQEYFGDATLREGSLNRVMVTTYDMKSRLPYFFKSWKPPYNGARFWQAARATSAAPTFFPPLRFTDEDGKKMVLVDGGIYVNNPSVSAYAEAKRLFPNDKITMVSIGTGELTRKYSHYQVKRWGKIKWLQPLLNSMFDGMSDACDYQMEFLIAKQDFYRCQVELDKGDDKMDNASRKNINRLVADGEALIQLYSARLDKLSERLRNYSPKKLNTS